eukprot:2638719-Alexandrium_andersonii.AAC.1
MPNGPNGPLHGSEAAKIGQPPLSHCQAQEAPREARRLLRLDLWNGASPTFADSEPRIRPFGPLGVLGLRPPRAGFLAPSSL